MPRLCQASLSRSICIDVTTAVPSSSQGIEEAGGEADLYRIPGTLSKDVLDKMNPTVPHPSVLQSTEHEILETYDEILFGIPTCPLNGRHGRTVLAERGFIRQVCRRVHYDWWRAGEYTKDIYTTSLTTPANICDFSMPSP
ncbi:hypothetical protein AC579_2858 [Pseudocercospora musae]|uniref:Uncharacterized protein n=1 Tax=Pseudocercospora musae TaxID=113226 RepID=A0A139I3M5_9PEZI|nr:hypothetical protein AC579_2858 [Pseudocercospora musae]